MPSKAIASHSGFPPLVTARVTHNIDYVFFSYRSDIGPQMVSGMQQGYFCLSTGDMVTFIATKSYNRAF